MSLVPNKCKTTVMLNKRYDLAGLLIKEGSSFSENKSSG
jgi:hypothetical protein